jgi:hypothetical protein
MKTTVDVFISYCFNPCFAGSIVTAVFSEIAISDATPPQDAVARRGAAQQRIAAQASRARPRGDANSA